MFRSLLLALPLVFIAASATAGDTDAVDCKNAMVQNDLNFCANKDYQASDKKLNAVYAKVMAAVQDPGYQAKLKAAQRAWILFRDSECTFEVAINEGGSIYPMVNAMCLTKVTDARTKELQTYLECWNAGDKCMN